MIARRTCIGAGVLITILAVITSACSSSSTKSSPPTQSTAIPQGAGPAGQWQPLQASKPVSVADPFGHGDISQSKSGDTSSAPAAETDSDDSTGEARPLVPAPAPSVDPVLDRGIPPSATPLLDRPDVSFEGISESGSLDEQEVNPPDAVGDIGKTRYVEATNEGVAIFDRQGNRVEQGAMRDIFAAAKLNDPCSQYDRGDPEVAYDERADRFVLTQFAFPLDSAKQPTGPGYSCIAVSSSGDATGWCVAEFKYPNDGFYDYPKLGVWGDSYVLSAVHYDDDNVHETFALTAMERAPLLDCSRKPGAVTKQITQTYSSPYWIALDADGTEVPTGPPTFVGFDFATNNHLQIVSVTPDFANNTATEEPLLSLTVAKYDSNLCGYQKACLPEPAAANGQPGAKLDAVSDRMMNRAMYRQSGSTGNLVLSHAVDIDGHDHAGVRWYELAVNDNTWSLVQDGTFAPNDGNNRWLSSIDLNAEGDIALAYSVAGPKTLVGARATGRLSADPTGKLTLGESILVPGVGVRAADSNDAGNNRWGDYSALTTDPTDDCRFWFTGEYTDKDGDWATKITSFVMPQCGTP
jgi:hypothetical protein